MNPEQQALVQTIKGQVGQLPAAGQREVLEHLVATLGAANLKDLSPEAKAALTQTLPADTSRDAAVRSLITQANGIFIGKEELVKLGKIDASTQIPAIPEKYSQAFLQDRHPIRYGTIASHVILAFDLESNQWICIDRGQGGESDVVPGSLGNNRKGVPGDQQDYLIKDVMTVGLTLRSPKDSYPVERTLNNAIALHLKDGKSIDALPFREILGRTADTARAVSGCRFLLGESSADGAHGHDCLGSNVANCYVGLLACWS